MFYTVFDLSHLNTCLYVIIKNSLIQPVIYKYLLEKFNAFMIYATYHCVLYIFIKTSRYVWCFITLLCYIYKSYKFALKSIHFIAAHKNKSLRMVNHNLLQRCYKIL